MPAQRVQRRGKPQRNLPKMNIRSGSAASPEWVAGEDAVFKTPRSLAIPSRPNRRTSVYLRRLQSPDGAEEFQGGFALPDVPSPPGMLTRSRRSSIYVHARQPAKLGSLQGQPSKLPQMATSRGHRGRGKSKATSVPLSKNCREPARDLKTKLGEEPPLPEPASSAKNPRGRKRTQSKEPEKESDAGKAPRKKAKADKQEEASVTPQKVAANKTSHRQPGKSKSLGESKRDGTQENESVAATLEEKETGKETGTDKANGVATASFSPKVFYKTPPRSSRRKPTVDEENDLSFTKLKNLSEQKVSSARKSISLTSTPWSVGKPAGRGKTPRAAGPTSVEKRTLILESTGTPGLVKTLRGRESTLGKEMSRATTPRTKAVSACTDGPFKTPSTHDSTVSGAVSPLNPVENLSVDEADGSLSQSQSQPDENGCDVTLNSSSMDNSADVSATPSSFRFGCQIM